MVIALQAAESGRLRLHVHVRLAAHEEHLTEGQVAQVRTACNLRGNYVETYAVSHGTREGDTASVQTERMLPVYKFKAHILH